MSAYPHELQYKLNDLFEISVGPRDNYDGIKSCLTYNPPKSSHPGYQPAFGVSILYLLCDQSIHQLNQLTVIDFC